MFIYRYACIYICMFNVCVRVCNEILDHIYLVGYGMNDVSISDTIIALFFSVNTLLLTCF